VKKILGSGLELRGRNRPTSRVCSLDHIVQERVAMEANTAAYDLVVTL